MKRLAPVISLMCMAIFYPNAGHTQFVLNGNDAYYTGGNVGIGTMSPGCDLHVRYSDSYETPDNVAGLFVENGGTSNSSFVLQTATLGGGKSLTVTNAGNVGIGTTSPGVKLQVDGGTLSVVNKGYGKTLLNLVTDRYWSFRQLGTGASTALELASVGGGGNKNFIISTDGNVGIGTTAYPGAKLHVHSTGDGVYVGNADNGLVLQTPGSGGIPSIIGWDGANYNDLAIRANPLVA